jgi:hypothetical protein
MKPSARVLVPNLMPYAQHFTLWLAPGGSREVTLRWDGEVVVQTQLVAGWQPVSWVVHDMSVGEHELAIEAPLGPFAGSEGWPRARRPVGVAVNLLEVTFVRP